MSAMDIYYDFDFINEDMIQDVDLGGLIIKKEDIETVFNVVNDVITWATDSIYKKCFKRVYIILSDCPGTPNLFVDFEPTMDQLHVYLNIFSIIYDYYYIPEFRKAIFGEKWEEISLHEFSQFYFLHELGHIVHGQLGSPSERTVVNKFDNIILKHRKFYVNLDKKFKIDDSYFSNDGVVYKYEKAYRQIPSEKFADNFAFKYLNKLN